MRRFTVCTSKSGGLTLAELVIVLLILAILAAAAAPRFIGSLHRYRAEAAAARVAHDLRFARRQATAQSASQTVQFNSPAAHQYELVNLDDPHRPGQPYVVNLASEPYLAVIVSADFGGDATIVFNGYGRPDSIGTVTVQSGTVQRIVTVDADTGKAEVQ